MNRSALAWTSQAGIVFATLLFPIASWAQESWSSTTLTGAPDGRQRHTAVWTGQEMIVWGGDEFVAGALNSGGRYAPSIDAWAATSLAGAPSGRLEHTALWTGNEMIVWGGYGGDRLNTGGRYDPQQDRWTATDTSGAPTGRNLHTAVWTGQEMIVWGGDEASAAGDGCGADAGSPTNSGARYDPQTNSWAPITTTGAPSARFRHMAVWTGQEMIVWGGIDGSNNSLNSGARYNPLTDSWSPITDVGAPPAGGLPVAVWTGEEMVIWGAGAHNSGGRYSPQLDSWATLPTLGAPSARYGYTAVWTGGEVIVWGGATSTYEATGARYSIENDSWVATSLEGAPSGRLQHSAVWTGSRMIVWGGTTNSGWDRATGGSYGDDASPPVGGRVGDGSTGDLVSQVDRGSISANWFGFGDPESGISRYHWAIGTSPGATDVMPFTDVGSATTASATQLSLETGATYYATVRATNGAGQSVIATSNGVLVEGAATKEARCSASASPSGSPPAALSMVLLLASWLGSARALRKRRSISRVGV
jgi:hypothetical protein